MTNTLNYTASNPDGRKCEVRQSENLWDKGYSVFTWLDVGTGVIQWREKHELEWNNAYRIAQEWVNV